MSFTNLYYKRTAGTPKACFVCSKPTTTVLATISTVDFIYTCPTHLADTGFASPVVDPEAAKTPTVSQEDIGKVIADWEDRQKRKKDKEEKEKATKDKDSKDSKDDDSAKVGKDTDSKDAAGSPKFPGSFSPKSAPVPTHERFTLHRDIFSMRLGEHRKRRQAAQAKDLAPRLPGAPRGTF
ncbi:VPS4-associated protein 1 [Mycena latifolia]|nr:VPS4-associated protein 1 [Mycena latifolia]